MFGYILYEIFLFFNLRRKLSLTFLILTMLIMSIVLGFRSENVGADTSRYISYYNYIESGLGYMEMGWNLLSIYCKKIGFSPYLFHFFIAFVSLGSITFVVIKDLDRKAWIYSLFCLYSFGFYFIMFNGMRQMFASSITLLAFHFLTKNIKITFVLLTILASLFHTSTLLVLPMVLLNNFNLSDKIILFAMIVSFIIGINLSPDSLSLMAGGYAHDVTDFGLRNSLSYAFTVGLGANILFFLLYRSCDILQKRLIWIKLFFISIIVMNLTLNLVIGPRVVYLFSISQIIAIPLMLTNLKKISISYIFFILIGFVTFGRFLYGEYYSNEGSLLDYNMTLIFFL